jgi:propanediol utilization protein
MPTHSQATGTELHEDKRVKQPVRVASTAALSIASPGSSIDGVTLVAGDRVLLKNQASAFENGLYT